MPCWDLSYLSSRSVELIADHIALPSGAGTVELDRLLPQHLRERLTSAAAMLRDVPAGDPPAKHKGRGRTHVTDDQYIPLIKRMVAANMLDFTTTPRVVNGIFAVLKDGNAQRLIIDARKANAEFKDPPSVSLPTPDKLSGVQAERARKLYIAKADIDNFYHRLTLPVWLRPFFALPPVQPAAISADLVLRFGAGPVWPVCRTLPMGWSWSVLLAQAAHEQLIDTAVAAMPAADRIGSAVDLRLVGRRVLHSVYIDDVSFWGHDRDAVQAVWEAYCQAVVDAGLVPKRSKCVGPSADGVEVLGLLIDGREHTLGVSPVKLLALRQDTFALLRRGHCTGLNLAVLLGHWTWAALANRPALSVFSAVYRFVECAGSRQFTIWDSVARELSVMAGLAPLLVAHLSRPDCPRAVATDASESGMGVVACDTPALPHALPRGPSADEGKDSAAGVSVAAVAWTVVVSSAWRFAEEHINGLEMRAADAGVRWLLSSPSAAGATLTLITDSTVVAGALRKGRSSSPLLLRRLRRIGAALLAVGAALDVRFVRSAFNPADGPSRAWSGL